MKEITSNMSSLRRHGSRCNKVLTGFFSAITIALLVSGCMNKLPDKAYMSRGNPNNLLDNSSERVSFGLATAGGVGDMVSWINKDQPSRAELSCSMNSSACQQAKEALGQFRVPYKMTGSSADSSSVTLIYDRIVARDCDSRYVDNSFNPYNLNHRTFGCSVAANIVQSVPDQSEFTSPALMDTTDAQRPAALYENYLNGKGKKSHGGCDGKMCPMGH